MLHFVRNNPFFRSLVNRKYPFIVHTRDNQPALPLAVWRKILKYRISDSKTWIAPAQLMLVCKAWHRLVWSVCKKIDHTTMPAGYLNVVVRNSLIVRKLVMDRASDLSLIFALSAFTGLTTLELLHCPYLTDKGIRQLPSLQGIVAFSHFNQFNSALG